MQAAITFEDAESEFLSLLDSKPLQVNDLLSLIHSVALKDNKKSCEWTNIITQELIEAGDFHGLYQVVKSRGESLVKSIGAEAIVDDLKRCCKERMILAFIDTVSFESQPLEDSFRQLDILLALSPGTQVIDTTWGFGKVKRLDNFYKRVTIDFKGKPGHNLTFQTACESLIQTPSDHILAIQANAPEKITRLIKEEPDELVKLAIKSYGRMPVSKLEATLIDNKFVKTSEWKNFWDKARKKLRNDPLVVIPSKRTKCIEILEQAARYDQEWFKLLENEKAPPSILNSVLKLEEFKILDNLSDERIAIINDRLGFALRGADNTNPALYVKLILLCDRNNFVPDVFNPETTSGKPIEDPRSHLWASRRFIKAARKLPIKQVASMVDFLLSEGDDAVPKLLKALPAMPYNLLNESLRALKENPEASIACREILTATKAPPTLINWVFRYRNELPDCWDLPPLIELLHHAVITVETTLTGENLRMQNALKKLFASGKWLKAIFEELSEAHRHLMFERIQASSAWDPLTHRALIARMLKLDPTLEKRKITTDNETAAARLTSRRSMRERQRQYQNLIKVEMAKNSDDIAVARSYGDLRENFEYQAAKDHQRQLLRKQAQVQLELELVKETDFANIPNDVVAPGTTVDIKLEDESEKRFTILGEWDSDEELNIISNKTTMATSLIGKKTGESAMIPTPGGKVKAEVIAIRTLDDCIKAWIAATP